MNINFINYLVFNIYLVEKDKKKKIIKVRKRIHNIFKDLYSFLKFMFVIPPKGKQMAFLTFALLESSKFNIS